MMAPDWHDVPHPAEEVVRARDTYPALLPPHSIEAERECLAACLVGDSKAVSKLAKLLDVADFYGDRHQRLWSAMLELRARSVPIDPVTLQQRLVDRGDYERVGGARAIGELLDRAGTVAHVEHYADIVRSKAAARALMDVGQGIIAAGYSGADAELESYMAESAMQLRAASERFRPSSALQLRDWSARRYQGTAPPVEWLVPDILARKEAHILASEGDTGKGFLTLNLGLQLASGRYLSGRRAPFGRTILPSMAPVSCVMLYAEDAEDALHRRLEALDPDGELRDLAGDRLMCVAMPSAGGAMSIIERTPSGTFRATERWLELVEQLSHIGDLGLLLIDPFSCFTALDLDKESSVAAALSGELARVATVLGCAVLGSHHMRKAEAETKQGKAPELPNHGVVRAQIRGVAALLNGVRMAYGIVPLPGRYARAVLDKLGERGELDVGRVYWGAVVKANGKTDRRPRLYVRADYGLLEDRTGDIAPMGRLEDALNRLLVRGES